MPLGREREADAVDARGIVGEKAATVVAAIRQDVEYAAVAPIWIPHPVGYLQARDGSDRQLEVLRVRPGITSPATLAHRDEEAMLTGPDFEEKYRREILPAKLRIELDYLSERTLGTDVRILAQTAVALFRNPTTGDSTRGSSECRS